MDGGPGCRIRGICSGCWPILRGNKTIHLSTFKRAGDKNKDSRISFHNRAVVSTRIGAYGIPIQADSGLFREDDPQAFAQKCATLLNDHRFGKDAPY